MYFLYIVGSSFAMCSAVVPLSTMYMVPFMFACRNAPGISVTIKYIPSFASMPNYIIISSSDTVGGTTSLCLYIATVGTFPHLYH